MAVVTTTNAEPAPTRIQYVTIELTLLEARELMAVIGEKNPSALTAATARALARALTAEARIVEGKK